MMNMLIEYANSAGDRWAAWVVATSLDAAVLLALVALVWFAIRNRVAPQVGYCLFLLVPLKVLVPVDVTVPARWRTGRLRPLCRHGSRAIMTQQGLQVACRFRSRTSLSQRSCQRSRSPSSSRHGRHRLLFGRTLSAVIRPIAARSRWEVASSGRALANTAAEPAHLSLSAIVMIAWLGGVVLLLVTLARAQWRFRVRLKTELVP